MKARYYYSIIYLLAQTIVCGQDRNDVTIDDYYVDFSVPDITAFSILDVNTSDVVRPGNVKEFAAGVVNYISESGNLKPGLAIEFAPYRLFSKSTKKEVSGWQKNKSLKNLQLSIATAQGDSTNLLAAWGINWTPIDKTDPVSDEGLQRIFAKYLSTLGGSDLTPTLTSQRQLHLTDVNELFGFLAVEQRRKILDLFSLDYQHRLARFGSDSVSYTTNMRDSVLAQLPDAPDSNRFNAMMSLISENATLTFREVQTEEEFSERFSAEVKKQKAIFLEENWNRFVVQFKAGGRYSADGGTASDLSILSYRIFGGLAGRVPGFGNGEAAKTKFARNSQVVCQLNYTSYRNSVAILNWEFSTGGRLLYGKADKRFSGEFLYSKASTKGESNETLEYIRYTVGGEMKVSEGLWFELAVGGQKFLQGSESARLVPEFGIKYAIQKRSRF